MWKVLLKNLSITTRYLNPPNHWVTAELESKELLALCIKKIKGLTKVKLVDAGFIWTEPHSRRIKVKLTIQKEVCHRCICSDLFLGLHSYYFTTSFRC